MLKQNLVHFISSIKKSQTNADQVEIKSNTLIASIGEGIIETDENGRINSMNKWAEEILGWQVKDYIGKILPREVLIEKEKGYFVPWEILLVKASTTTSKKVDVTFHSVQEGDEAKFLTPATIAPVIQRGRIVGSIVILPDINKEREIERMKSEFLSVAAHQLRSPLGSIRWGIEMLVEGDLGKIPQKAKETLQQIYTSNQWMITLVNDLLNVSRIDQGRIHDEPELTDHIEIIRAVIKEYELEAFEKKISIKLNAKKDCCKKIMIDPMRFREVIQNLLSNAVKYSRENGNVVITVDQSELLVKIIVADNGIGIPSRDKKEIFSRFFRASNAVKSKTEGTGLGLFVVKSYVARWGGSIWFESKEGKGTTFYLQFPIKSQKLKENG